MKPTKKVSKKPTKKTKNVVRDTEGDAMNKKLVALFKNKEFVCVGKTSQGYFISGASSRIFLVRAAEAIMEQVRS